MKQSTRSLFYDILILIFCICFFVVGVFNVLNYGDIKNDKNDVNLGLSRTWLEAGFWLNIALVCITGYFMLYLALKIIFKPDLKFKDVIEELFGDKAKQDYDMTISVGKNPIEAVQVAAVSATLEARKLGKTLNESLKIGTVAGTVAGNYAGINKGDSKIISKIASENIIRNELSKYSKRIEKSESLDI
jgi:hypothetical protein